ncbi:glycosyltransferase family 2 protein [Microlunatus soli]|uniref:Glycosyl transferase family 2 n=1 Tax=Microlunatus soli TaxID=630515 RepID=A0A1H1XA84_9ACTN|nr:glycosyltransferase family 2 protein [Microlunatus soli]SDT06217.1 Glycosyl transferase family 2 [Microlunatus soli]
MNEPSVGVSVIISTYNSSELLAGALLALRAQTLPPEQLEVIVVDDGSTDDTWSDLEILAESWPQLWIFRQPNSGTPSVGRNVGLRRATGRFVFFHDADDWMPPYALQELVDRADTLDADVVVGRTRSIGIGHRHSRLREAADADLITDGVWRSLSAQKLFRRTLLQRLGLEFCEDMVQGEDQIFAATALLAARRVSTLTEKTYYVRRRDRGDGGNLSRRPQSLANKVLTCSRLTRQIEASVPVDQQPAYFRRVLLRTLAPALDGPFMNAGPEQQAAALTELQATVLPHLTDRLLATVSDARRLRLLIAATGTAEDLRHLNRRLRDGTENRIVEQVSAHRTRKLRRYTDRLRHLLPLSGARRTPGGRAER